MKTPEKLYRCPQCGCIITDEEWEDEMEGGGSGYCMCDFMKVDGSGEVLTPRILHDYQVYHLSIPGETLLERIAEQFERDGFRYFKCEKCGILVHIDYLKKHRCSKESAKNGDN